MINWNGIVSLLICCIEAALAVNILISGRKKIFKYTAAAIVFILAGYQLAEFLMCGRELKFSYLAFIAFADITFLPPISFILVTRYLNLRNKVYYIFFIPAILFIIYYSTVIPSFAVVKCSPFYASYNYPSGTLYGEFYYAPVVISLILLSFKFYRSKGADKKLSLALLAGHIIMCVPVVIAFILKAAGNDALLSSIESIMCKFAIFYAIALTYFSIMYGKEDGNNNKHLAYNK